jgi:hypothetical protein
VRPVILSTNASMPLSGVALLSLNEKKNVIFFYFGESEKKFI